MEKLKFGIYICLLQPMNKTHFAAIELALSEVDNLIIVLGSAFKAKSIKHPWTFQEREQMIRSCFDTQENNHSPVLK
jgi:bifunctional NMN adenylyltransferase/nudix hydrolase